MRMSLLVATVVALSISNTTIAQQRDGGDPPEFSGARSEVYKSVGDVKLRLFVFEPKDHKPTDARPAIVFFFGGGFVSGSPSQFHQHCRYFASRGLVAITADYRVKNRHRTTPADSIQDGKDALRYVRSNAKRLGVDPNRIVASGGSAGALIAACVGVIPSLDKSQDKTAVSYGANAMVLFNPAVVGKTPVDRKNEDGSPGFPKDIMPYYHISSDLPPSIMCFGEQDKFLTGANEFQKAARAKKNLCKILTWKDEGHGFFNFGRNDNKGFVGTLKAADEFLGSLGYIKGASTVDEFASNLPSNSTEATTTQRDSKKQTRKTNPRNRQEARRRAKEREVARFLRQLDKNKDGVLDQSELPAALKRLSVRLDKNKDGKLSKTELLRMPGRAGSRPGEIITAPARGERFADKLKVGDTAPNFTLADPNGKQKVTLATFKGKRPVVLIFGSYT